MGICKYFLSFTIGVLWINLCTAQQVWPVQVTGSLVPPHSLNLGVYGAERTQDLTFNAMLKDPVQASIDVRLSLSIEQNGKIIYQTDPNYLGMPITLNQFQNIVLDGNALRSYLNNQALTGANGSGIGSLEIPEGFNQICLQIYGVERNVPISNKFCMSGNFRLNQPPQIVKPSCGEKLKMPPSQNMLFNWQPMHLGSPNSPGAVEYEFELVQLPQGTFNANDVFDSALKIYTTKSFSASLIYTQAEPPLEPNKVYAWRVKAASVMYPSSKLFQNDGISQICTFMLYLGDEPTDDINPINNPSPKGCEVFSTEYGAVGNSEPISNSVIEGDIVKVGYFNMKVQSVSGGPMGYSGKAWMEYPMLRSSVEVSFQNIKINKERRVYDAENIEAIIDLSLKLPNEKLRPKVIDQNVNASYVASLHKATNASKKVAKLSVNSVAKNTLPLALQNDQFPNSMVFVTGIKFTPTNAYLTLIGLESDDVNGKKIDENAISISAATAIPSTPYGIKSGSYLVPIAQNGGGSNAKTIIPSLELVVSSDGDSRLNCACNGTKDRKIKEVLQISPDVLVRADNGGPVVLELSDSKADKSTYFGEAKILSAFEIKGIEGFAFYANQSFIDLSNTSTIRNPVTYANADKDVNSPTWKGLFIQNASVKLPKTYDLLNDKNGLTLDKGELLINQEGISYGRFSKENLISIDRGKVDKWQYSVDEMSISIQEGTFEGPSIKGQLKLPVASDLIPYSGNFNPDKNENSIMVIDEKPTLLDISMWQSSLSLDALSLITAEIKDINNSNVLYPKANLTGQLNMKMDGASFNKALKGNVAEINANLASVFKVNEGIRSIGMEGIEIQNWNIDPYNSLDKKYSVGNIDISKAKLVINDQKFPISNAIIKMEMVDGKESLGLIFTSNNGNSKVEMSIWAIEKNGQFTFSHINQSNYNLQCDCVEGASYGILIRPNFNNQKEYQGSLANTPEVTNNQQSIYGLLSEKITSYANQDFILKDDKTLYWPLIDKDLLIEKQGKRIVLKDKILIDNLIFSKLGFKTLFNIPKNATIYISTLEIEEWKDTNAKANVTFELEASYDFKDLNKLMVFKSQKIVAEGNAIKLENIDLFLENPKNDADWKLENYTWSTKPTGAQNKNLARIDCISGFTYFQMSGEVILPDMVNKADNSVATLPFNLKTSSDGNSHSLIDFIGICQEFVPNKSDTKWNIYPKELPQVSFNAGEQYVIYFDNSSVNKIPGSLSSDSYSKSTSDKAFKGVVFENASCELLGFYDSKKNPLSLPIKDAVYAFSDSEKGFYVKFEMEDVLNKEDGSKISGWKYGLETVSYQIKNSRYEKELEFKGAISIPIFKTNPDQIKSVKFDSSWVDFTGSVYVSTSNNESKVSSFFEFDDVSFKTFQSDFIPGLGVVLNDDSNISLVYNITTKNWDPSGTFSGLGIVLLTSETMKAYGLKSFPDGMDFSLHCLTFEGLTLNEKPASASVKLIDEYGIKSIEFGTWGVVDYSSYFNDEEEKEEKEEPETKKEEKESELVPEVSTASGKIVRKKGEVKTVSTASGKIVKTKEGVKSVSTASGSVKRVKKTSESTENTAPVTANADTEPEFNGMNFGVECYGVKAVGDKFELGIGITLSLLGDNKEKKGEKEEVKTCGLNAKGGLGLEFSRNKEGRFVPDGIKFNCLALDGSIGPLDFEGGLSLLRTPKDENGKVIILNNHGTGFKAYLSATVMGLGGIQAVGQFGKKYMSETESYYYGFVDLEAFKQSGFPIPPPSPGSPPVIDLYGGGGGVRINMKSANSITELKIKPDSNIPPADDCPIPDAKYLAPGVGFSQNYEPEKGSYGGNFYLILGPWNELDNQNPPIYSIIAEPGVDIEISTDQATGDLQFRKISLNINAYFKPTSLAKRRNENIADAFAKLELNMAERALVGAFGMRMKVEADGLKSPLIQMPEEYDKTDFNTKANYVGGKLVFSFDNRNGKSPFFNFKFGGSSIGKFTSASGLKYNTAAFNLNDVLKLQVGAYFQIGKDVDDFPPIKELIPQISDMESAKYDEVQSDENTTAVNSKGAGISFGFRGNLEGKTETGPLIGNFNVGLGFNILMREMQAVNCTNTSNGSIGIKNWYAQGQAFGYANCDINLAYNFLFTNGRVNIMKAGAFIYLKAMAPNPSYFSGRINGTYSVLDGLLDGSFNCSVQLGEKCENLEAPSPLEGIYIYNYANIVDGETNVDRYTDINLSTNIPLQKEFNVPQTNAEGNEIGTATFIADIKSIEVTKYLRLQGGIRIARIQTFNQKIQANKKEIGLTFDSPLLPNSDYELKYTFVWKKLELVNGVPTYIENFESGKQGDNTKQPKIETGIIKFTTGDRPTKIVSGMVEYMAPGDGQRYWHKGYANTEIKFKLKALEDAANLFPDTCHVCLDFFGRMVKYKYSVQLSEYGLDGKLVKPTGSFTTGVINSGDYLTLPITSFPRQSEMAKILRSKSLSVNNGQYQINVLSEENLPISQVSFPDLKNLQLTKGAMYKLIVVREPMLNLTDFSTRDVKSTINTYGTDNAAITIKREKNDNIESGKLKKMIEDNTTILHSSFFAASNYNSINDKINLLEVNHVKSTIKRRDFQHPNDAYDGQRAAAISKYGESKFHSVKDDYYAFTIKNDNLEGFDKYDIMRLKLNIKLSYNDTYVPEQRIKIDRYDGKGIHPIFDNLLSGFNDIGGYMRKVLYEYSKAETEGIAQYGDLNLSDGSKWHYNITGPKDEKCAVLQSDEIAAKKVIHKIGYKTKSDPNYSDPVFANEIEFDFLLQDYRSRIIINQMAWLSRLSNTNTTNNDLNKWLPGNYPEGEFLSENKRFNNFDWVLYADSDKKEKGNKFTYIASEPGYQFSYHGGSTISFPMGKNWAEMTESKREGDNLLNKVKDFSPNRATTNVTEQTVTNATELVENYWYKIKVNSEYLKFGDKNQAWSALWSVCFPYQNFPYTSGQYGIYSMGAGGLPTIREFRSVTNPMNGFENVWNFTSVGGNAMKVVNERYKNSNESDENRIFPKVFDHRDFKFERNKRSPSPPTPLPSQIEVLEISGLYFSPEKKYYLEDKGAFIKDSDGYNQWLIIQEGPYYRFVSLGGKTLKIDYYEQYKFIGKNIDLYNVKTDDSNFPSDKYGDPNGYYRSVWAVVPVSTNSEYFFIKNIRYPEYFLAFDNGKIIARKTDAGDQIKIREVKD